MAHEKIYVAIPICSSYATHWCPPCEGILKLNVDASKFPGYNGVGVAGIVRDHRGMLLGATLKCYKGDFSVDTVELLAVRVGLCFSLTHGFKSLIVESDASTVVSCINNKCITSSNGSVVGEILELFNFVGGGSCQLVMS